MKYSINIQRRKLLKFAGLTAAAAATYPSLLNAKSAVGRMTPGFQPDVEIELKQEVVRVPLFKGKGTRAWKVFGRVIKGPETALQHISGSYLAPIIRLQKGQKVRIILRNNLPEESILHWHGLHVPAAMDGNPMYAIHNGETYVYEFEVMNRAGTYWYHAHTHNVTARQVYLGLAGLLIVTDSEEQALGLPGGEYDVPIVLQDRSFDSENQFVYANHMMQRMQGFLGDKIMINGRADNVLPVASRAYRLRLLNGSNSRIYKLVWGDGMPITVLGVDGGLLQRPENLPYIILAPGERRELWVDFSRRAIGSELTLRSTSFAVSSHGGMMGGGMMGGQQRGMGGGMGMMRGRRGGMGGGMMGHNSLLPLGSEYEVLKVKVVRQEQSNDSLPKRLTKIQPLRVENAVNADNPRNIKLSMRHMSTLLNGRSYKMNDIQADEIIPVNTLQLIEFDNGFENGAMHGMMSMPHPMHLHGEQFQIVKRQINPQAKTNYQTVQDGLVDNGWKDTVLVMPGEKVSLLKPFNDYKGLFMYHCHNLEHEDLGMMRDFLIQ